MPHTKTWERLSQLEKEHGARAQALRRAASRGGLPGPRATVAQGAVAKGTEGAALRVRRLLLLPLRLDHAAPLQQHLLAAIPNQLPRFHNEHLPGKPRGDAVPDRCESLEQ